ncbi:MAG: hypothetical protein AMS24_00520 [Chlamydiae bacterium SM23_39]|nr:MAG: hypothetical protein AMS24_00520 [Chlamydiae bacterium SM23_39]
MSCNLSKSLAVAALTGTSCYFLPKAFEKIFPNRVQDPNISNLRYSVRKMVWKVENIHPFVKHYLQVTVPENLWIVGSLISFYLTMDQFQVSKVNCKDVSILFYAVNGGCLLIERVRYFVSRDLTKLIEKVFSEKTSRFLNNILYGLEPGDTV